MSLQSAMRAKLLADATIAGLVSTRIYGSYAPEGAALPYVTLQQIGGDSEHSLTGETRLASAIYQTNAWAATVDSALAIADAIRREIAGIRGTWGSGGETATVESCLHTNSFYADEDPVDGRMIPAVVGIIDEWTIAYIQTPAT